MRVTKKMQQNKDYVNKVCFLFLIHILSPTQKTISATRGKIMTLTKQFLARAMITVSITTLAACASQPNLHSLNEPGRTKKSVICNEKDVTKENGRLYCDKTSGDTTKYLIGTSYVQPELAQTKYKHLRFYALCPDGAKASMEECKLTDSPVKALPESCRTFVRAAVGGLDRNRPYDGSYKYYGNSYTMGIAVNSRVLGYGNSRNYGTIGFEIMEEINDSHTSLKSIVKETAPHCAQLLSSISYNVNTLGKAALYHDLGRYFLPAFNGSEAEPFCAEARLGWLDPKRPDQTKLDYGTPDPSRVFHCFNL